MNIEEELNATVQAMGIKDIKMSWNDEWLDRVRSMPADIKKEVEKQRALHTIKEVLDAFNRGEYKVVESIDADLVTN